MGLNWIGSLCAAQRRCVVYIKLGSWPVSRPRRNRGAAADACACVHASRAALLLFRPELRQGYPLNLSISLSGGEETNKDAPSNGERTAHSPT